MNRPPFNPSDAARQLEEVAREINRLRQSLAEARAVEAKIKADIGTYLDVNKHQGIMIGGTTILKQEKEVKKPLKKSEKEIRLKEALGDSATPEMLAQVQNALKGTTIIKKTIKVETK